MPIMSTSAVEANESSDVEKNGTKEDDGKLDQDTDTKDPAKTWAEEATKALEEVQHAKPVDEASTK